MSVVTTSQSMKCVAPCEDRQLSVAILLELAVQQADVAAFLDIVTVCLKVRGLCKVREIVWVFDLKFFVSRLN